MKRHVIPALIFCIAAPGALADDFSLLLFGASIHTQCNPCHLNQDNWGAGAEWAFSGNDEDGRWIARTGAYDDSYRKTAYFVSGGWRKEWQLAGPLQLGVILQGGYLNGSGRDGLVALPQISIGTRNLALEVGYMPKISAGGYHGKSAVTTFNLRWMF
ncbi:hypothetical protein CEK28_08305 [Xenophilus sp. AP218F]|nr:hypothetical protein CEK28_08305 [Xenophilus sp. AP218F]